MSRVPVNRIAAEVPEQLDRAGFSATSVDDLRDAAGVSLRTLYRRHGGREGVVADALADRADAYLAWLGDAEGVDQLFLRVERWMGDHGARGCLLLRARSEQPGSERVRLAVVVYHQQLRELLVDVAARDGLRQGLGDQLFVLHEGLVASAPVLGPEAASRAARRTFAHLAGAPTR